ncbi:hypothetical protein AYB34_11600 [Leptospira sp. ZV016]|nr:hypothetical protein AYB32_12425 [Leptospira kirschneri]KXZ33535.1 hypothetical protein AYB34_11600 [Leptospira sp. ZV016]
MILPTNYNFAGSSHKLRTMDFKLQFFKKTGVPRMILPTNYNFAGSSHKLRTMDFKLSFF